MKVSFFFLGRALSDIDDVILSKCCDIQCLNRIFGGGKRAKKVTSCSCWNECKRCFGADGFVVFDHSVEDFVTCSITAHDTNDIKAFRTDFFGEFLCMSCILGFADFPVCAKKKRPVFPVFSFCFCRSGSCFWIDNKANPFGFVQFFSEVMCDSQQWSQGEGFLVNEIRHGPWTLNRMKKFPSFNIDSFCVWIAILQICRN